MNDSTKKIIFTVLVSLPTLLVVWVFSLYFFGCGTTNTCTGIQLPAMTPIPTLLPATLPAPKVGADAALAGAPKCRIAALNLIGAWVSAGFTEKDPFPFSDVKGASCTATFQTDVQKLFVTPNLWYDGAPACITCHYADIAKATKNMDLSSYAGILAGSNRLNGAPKGNDILGGGNWDNALLHKMLFAPNGKTEIGRPAMPLGRPATVPAEGPVISAGAPAGSETIAVAFTATPQAAITPTESAPAEIARPSNPGDPGAAITLKGNAATGGKIFSARCAACHGDQGKAGIPNPGSDDGSVPALNPIDSTLVSTDATVFATNLDLFIEHGSKPAGEFPVIAMPPWGDQKLLAPQEIADLIAYLMELNNPAGATADAALTPTPESAQATPTAEAPVDVARPSNPGGPGDAIKLVGDVPTGEQIFVARCAACHGDQGKAGIPNPGSDDGTVPALNPIDSTLISPNATVYATNLDLFIEHGSTPAGKFPVIFMPPWGDKKLLAPQEIADLIAYLISLNPPAK